MVEHSWLDLEQVRSCSDGHLLLEPTGAASTAHEHEGIFCVWLQPCDQLPLQTAWDLQALLAVEDLKASQMWLIRKQTDAEASVWCERVKTQSRLENLNGALNMCMLPTDFYLHILLNRSSERNREG